MSNISQFFAGSRKKNRRIFQGTVGVTTVTWLVPPGVTEVEVHCWGAGGGDRGGGGGYVTHVFPVTSSDRLLITAGAAPGGTSSVSVPTQSPTSPISATGGSGNTGGAAGGSGSYTIAPGISTARTFSASGGLSGPAGGGAAGSPQGTGGAGAGGGGGGIGGPGAFYPPQGGGGGGSLGAAIGLAGGLGANGYRAVTSLATPTNAVYTDNLSGGQDNWFYVDEILGSGGSSGPGAVANGGAGGGGGYGGFGGILGGGGRFAPGGLAGGGGDGNNGGAGLVILYW